MYHVPEKYNWLCSRKEEIGENFSMQTFTCINIEATTQGKGSTIRYRI